MVADRSAVVPGEQDEARLHLAALDGHSLLARSNRTVGEWGDVFVDTMVATANLDRLLPSTKRPANSIESG